MLIEYDAIDGQHQALVDIINRAADRIGRGGAASKSLSAPMRKIATAMRRHFEHEELLMERLRYPALGEHRAHHRVLLSQVKGIAERVMIGIVQPRDGVEDIFNTLVDDMLRADLAFKEFLEGKGLIGA